MMKSSWAFQLQNYNASLAGWIVNHMLSKNDEDGKYLYAEFKLPHVCTDSTAFKKRNLASS